MKGDFIYEILSHTRSFHKAGQLITKLVNVKQFSAHSVNKSWCIPRSLGSFGVSFTSGGSAMNRFLDFLLFEYALGTQSSVIEVSQKLSPKVVSRSERFLSDLPVTLYKATIIYVHHR